MPYTKEELIKALEIAGDACINFDSPVSGKAKYVVATTDFTTPYIKEKLEKLKSAFEPPEDSILVFSWDTDRFKQIDPITVTSIEPLNQMIPNVV